MNRRQQNLTSLASKERRNGALEARNDELERFNKVLVGRELRMIELKRDVNALCARLGEPPRYPLEAERNDNGAALDLSAHPAELEEADTDARDARLATLNILEDAVEAREHAERVHRELRESEERLLRLNEVLEERVHERTAELEAEVSERRAGEERIKNLLRQLVTIEERERRRHAREVHHTMGQQLAALHLSFEVLKAKADYDPAVRENIDRMREVFGQLNSNVEFLAWELRPPTLDLLGLDAATESYVRDWSQQFGVEAFYQGFGVAGLRLSPETEINMYRILQEALQNVHKHAGASRVNALFERRDQHAVLIVEDNGKGYDVETTGDGQGMGLTNMKERAALIGGSIEFESKPGDGTTVFVRVPVQ